MKNAKSTNKSRAAHASVWRCVKLTALITLVLLAAAQLVFDLYVIRRLNTGDNVAIISLIGQAVDGINKPAQIDPASGEVFLTDARLKLPPAEGTDAQVQILYSYTKADDSSGAELHVTTRQAISSAKARLWSAQSGSSGSTADRTEAVFDQVPRLQACGRGITVLFDAKTAANYNISPENIKRLQDGRILYFATDDVSKCGNSLDFLVAYLKQAESY